MEDLAKNIVPLGIGLAIIFGGYHLLKTSAPSIGVRLLLGLALLAIGIVSGYFLVFVVDSLEEHPFLFGLAVGATGLGINQVTAPIRVRMGGAP